MNEDIYAIKNRSYETKCCISLEKCTTVPIVCKNCLVFKTFHQKGSYERENREEIIMDSRKKVKK